ncbi:MAG: hypothetical protein KDK65_00905 [Chlamydiia bacterium]|nr:hypothetical protein [Chlamydiia bacterium]
MRRAWKLLALVVLVGCGRHQEDFFLYHEDGTPKPKVVIVPVMDETEQDNGQQLAQDVCGALVETLKQRERLYVLPTEGEPHRLNPDDFFGKDINFAKNYPNADFVVVLSLMEHGLVPYVKDPREGIGHTIAGQSQLKMQMRTRVIDVRGGRAPKIVLQEKRGVDHYVVQKRGRENQPSPKFLREAEEKLVNDLASRLEQEIASAR